MQHVRILGAGGVPWVSRMHLAMGAYAYVASSLWALSLLVGVVLSLQSAYTLPVYFPDTKTLFPVWPVIDPDKAFYLFLVTLAVLLLPKVLGLSVALLHPPENAPRPGLARLLSGALVEMLLSILVAPILMLLQTRAIVEILLGRDSGWSAQRRDGEAPAFSQLLRFHAGHLV